MSISIFAKRAFRARRDGHLQRVSSIIRGWQVAEQIGAKLNPQSDYENDVCIYVKPSVGHGYDFNFKGRPYLDIIDGWGLLPVIAKHPEVTVITCSVVDFEFVTNQIANKIVLIPQHHCNFERVKRNRNKITTVGCIGTAAAFPYLPQDLKHHLARRKMKLIEFSKFYTRQDIVDFYLKIDVQIVWRPYIWKHKVRMTNPLKLVNASSFGIPTIALEEPAFVEVKDCYFPVKNLDEFLARLDDLRSSPSLYADYSERCLKKAEMYHIENIAKLYQQLT